MARLAVHNRPRRTSWVDGLIGLIERLPGPPWVFYACVTVFFVAGSTGLRWLDGHEPWSDVDPVRLTYSTLTVYGLAVIHSLKLAANRSLTAFRPALGELAPDEPELLRKLTTMPASSALIATLVGIIIQIVGSLSSPTGWGISAENSLMTNAFTIGYEIIFSVLLVVFLFRAVAQLHTIVRIHREATNVNLYEIEPHSAFSRFTLRTSIAITVPYAFATVIAGIAEGIAPLEVVLFSLFLLISVALFVLPLSGMHRRLVQEKSRLIGESDRRFETINARLHRQVDSDQLERIEELEKALSALTIEADRLRKISTWPWRADTLRIFLSSIALPIVLWTITTLLSRVI